MARAQTTAQQAPTAWAPRAAISQASEGAEAPTSEARMKVSCPAKITGRRPKRSATGPAASCAEEKATRKTVRVHCTPTGPTPNSVAMAGSEGR